MSMTRREARDRIKELLPEYLQDHHGIEAAASGRKFQCLNPDHDDKHPSMSLYKDKRGLYRAKCQSCGANYDTLDIIRIDTGTTDQAALFLEAYRIFDLDVVNDNGAPIREVESSGARPNAPKPTPKPTTQRLTAEREIEPEQEEQRTDFTPFFKEAHANASRTDYFTRRGLTAETVDRFKLGFIDGWTHPKAKNAPPTPRAIYPTSRYSYLARDTREDIPERQKQYSKMKVGSVEIFNMEAIKTATRPAYIVEGEIDALTIAQTGRPAAALGTTSKTRDFIDRIDRDRPQQPLILALDNDEAGGRAAQQIADALAERGIFFYRLTWEGANDANDVLTQRGEADLIRQLERAERALHESMNQAATHSIDEANAQEESHEEDGLTIIDIDEPAPPADPLQGIDPAEIAEAEEIITAAREIASNITAWEQRDPEAKREYIEERRAYAAMSTGAHIREFRDRIAVNTPATPTGFTALDTELDGGLYEGLYILGAVPSIGKTALILQIADNVATAGADVLFFSLEMSRHELMARSISRHSYEEAIGRLRPNADEYEVINAERNAKSARGITTGSRYANYNEAEISIIDKAIEAYQRYAGRLYIIEGMGETNADTIRTAIKEHIERTGKRPLVIVDYLQILTPIDPRMTEKQSADKSVLELKRASRDYKTPVIVVSSFNRANYKTPVTEAAFKESGGIEYGSDVLFGLQLQGTADNEGFDFKKEKSKDPRALELHILKNRNGRAGGVIKFEYRAKFNYFSCTGIAARTTPTAAPTTAPTATIERNKREGSQAKWKGKTSPSKATQESDERICRDLD